MSVDPFPNELVEAAEAAIIAVVEDKLQWNVNAYGKAWTGEGEDTDFICGGTGQAVLAAVLPLIEQRVIDRLAREAGENPYDPWSSVEAHDGWRDGAACGAYAEGIADTVAKLRVRAAEVLPVVARFTLDEIEALAAADREAPKENHARLMECGDLNRGAEAFCFRCGACPHDDEPKEKT